MSRKYEKQLSRQAKHVEELSKREASFKMEKNPRDKSPRILLKEKTPQLVLQPVEKIAALFGVYGETPCDTEGDMVNSPQVKSSQICLVDTTPQLVLQPVEKSPHLFGGGLWRPPPWIYLSYYMSCCHDFVNNFSALKLQYCDVLYTG